MITKEKAFEIAKKFLKDKNVEYKRISDKIDLEEDEIPVGKFEDKTRKIFSIAYYTEGYQYDTMYEIVINAEEGEILFVMTPHRFIEPRDW